MTAAAGGRSTATGRSAWGTTGPTTTATTVTTLRTAMATATRISRAGPPSRWARRRFWSGVPGDIPWCRGARWRPASGAVEAASAARSPARPGDREATGWFPIPAAGPGGRRDLPVKWWAGVGRRSPPALPNPPEPLLRRAAPGDRRPGTPRRHGAPTGRSRAGASPGRSGWRPRSGKHLAPGVSPRGGNHPSGSSHPGGIHPPPAVTHPRPGATRRLSEPSRCAGKRPRVPVRPSRAGILPGPRRRAEVAGAGRAAPSGAAVGAVVEGGRGDHRAGVREPRSQGARGGSSCPGSLAPWLPS